MSNSDVSVSFGGSGLSIFVIFLVLKLVGVITWSWWWVCSPLIISFGLFIVALLINDIAIPEEYRKYTKWFCYLFLVLTIICYSQQKTKQSNDSNLIVRKEKTVEKETAWEKIVKVSGRKINGTLIYVDEAGYYQVNYLGGKIYDTPEDKARNAAYDVLGASYDPEWKDYFIYSDIPEVKAVEALIIVDGEIGSGDEKVYQLSERSKEVNVWVNEYLRIFRHEPDVVDQAGDHY